MNTVLGLLKNKRFLLSVLGVASAVAYYLTGSEVIGNAISSVAAIVLNAVGL